MVEENKICPRFSGPVPSAGYPNGVRDIRKICIKEKCEHWVLQQRQTPAHCCDKASKDA